MQSSFVEHNSTETEVITKEPTFYVTRTVSAVRVLSLGRSSMFSPVNLEADVHLIDLDSETVPPASQPVTLVIRQGIEIPRQGS